MSQNINYNCDILYFIFFPNKTKSCLQHFILIFKTIEIFVDFWYVLNIHLLSLEDVY